MIEIFLKKSGISGKYKGYKYLYDAINYALLDDTLLKNVTTDLYCLIAEKYGTTWQAVERSIRFAIDKCWRSSGRKFLEEIGYGKIKKPYARDFIYMGVFYIENYIEEILPEDVE